MIKRLFSSIYKEVPLVLVSIMIISVPLFYAPFFNHSFSQGKQLLFVLLVSLLALWCFFKISCNSLKANTQNKTIMLISLLCMYGIFTFTNAFSAHPEVIFFGSISRGLGFNVLLVCLLLALMVAYLIKSKNIQTLLKIALIPAAVNAVYAILQKSGIELFFKNYRLDIFEGRSFGLYGNPSYLGQALSLFFIIALYFTVTEKKYRTAVLYGATSLTLLAGIIVSGTRTSFLGLIAAVGLLFFKFILNKISLSKKIIAGTCVILLTLGNVAYFLSPSRFSLSPIATRSLESRFEIWKGAIELIKEKPLIGHGTNTFQIYFPDKISKDFYALEENLSLNVDRVHNETLEVIFQYGILGGFAYLLLLTAVLYFFIKSKNKFESLLALLILTYHVQNQVSFPDISIMMFAFICYGGVLAVGTRQKSFKFQNSATMYVSAFAVLLLAAFFMYTSFYKPLMSELAYTESQKARGESYEKTVTELKSSIAYMPYYTETWYELMMIDSSNRERGLHYLRQLEGDTGNVNAWMGNLYAKTDPEIATEYYIKALERNPYHPNWIRAFADMLFYHEDYENALFMYSKYLDAIPEIWYVDEEHKGDAVAEKKARIFLKNTPYLIEVFEKIEFIEGIYEE